METITHHISCLPKLQRIASYDVLKNNENIYYFQLLLSFTADEQKYNKIVIQS